MRLQSIPALVLLITAASLRADDFETLRLRWRDVLTGGTNLNFSNPAIARGLEFLSAVAQTNWDTLQKSSSRSLLWSDLASTGTDSAQVTTTYDRLMKMALAYATRGSRLESDPALRADLISALDWMWSNRYNASKGEYGNWWDWEIGTPLHLNDITVVLYSDLSSAQIRNYMDAVNHFTPSPTKTAANRVWQATVVGVRGAVVKDGAKLLLARDGLSQVFVYTTSGDGFYTDGSFIQHDIYSYNGGYGNSLLANIVPLMFLLNGSPWQVSDPNRQNVYRWIHSSYEPLVYRGAMMDMVRGREISRSASSDHAIGASVISSVIRCAQFAPSNEACVLRSLAKSWIETDTFRDYLQNAPVPLIPQAQEILSDTYIPSRPDLTGHFHFARMDRAVHLRPNFAFGLSMSSKRIGNYESINNENLRGWYTGDGMTCLYNADLGQFSDGFWPTVNSYRLPGTTVDTLTRSAASGQGYRGSYDWVGGVSLDDWGVAGMQLDSYNSTLTAKKSWFMFDDEIVALGAGITCSDSRVIETIVENRKLDAAGDNLLTVNDQPQSSTIGWSAMLTNISWAHLQGSVPGSDIGYYFPRPTAVKMLREARTNSWYEINNKSGDPSPLTRNYLALWLDHGLKPTAASYSYVLLPNKTPDQIRAYATNADVVIVENSANAQAVSETRLGIKAANFWNDATYTVAGITATKKSSVLLRQSPDELAIAISDPTQLGSTVTLQIDAPVIGTNSLDSGITVQALSPKLKLSINVANSAGKTFRARFQIVPASPPRLSIQSSNSQTLLLSWPTIYPGYHLQAQTNVTGLNPAGPWLDVTASTNPPVPVSIDRAGAFSIV